MFLRKFNAPANHFAVTIKKPRWGRGGKCSSSKNLYEGFRLV